MWWQLVFSSLLLGVGLAMDACAVSMANGLNEPKMKVGKISLIAFMFGFFQALMPMIGWVCVHFVAQQFEIVAKIVPYVALALLSFIGGKMIFDGVKEGKERKKEEQAAASEAAISTDAEQPVETEQPAEAAQPVEAPAGKSVAKRLTFGMLLTQALATSIDALSVGFTIAEYNVWEALISVCIIAVVTFGISFGAVFIGKKFGTKLGNKAEILGGCILIAIGIEIFVTSFF